MISICFVCTGNTCRSVMAERLMKKHLKEMKVKDVKVCSKGLRALGDNIAENAKLALKDKGAQCTNRKSKKLGKIEPKTIYVTMTDAQKSQIASKNVISYSDLIGRQVCDPYGQDLQAYKACCDQLDEGTKVLINKILKWRG